MPFIGNQPALSYTSFAKQDFTTSATTSYTLDNPVTNENELALFINFVRQEPTTAYTASGTTLTLTSATSASDDMYCVFLGKAVQTVNPPNGSVGTAQISSSARATNLLYPAFEVKMSTDQTITNSIYTKVNFDDEVFDTDNMFDATTNYRFTPTVAGKYFFFSILKADANADLQLDSATLAIYKNGVRVARVQQNEGTNNSRSRALTLNYINEANGSTDYYEIYIYISDTSGSPTVKGSDNTFFGAYRIGD